jgi:hypothetical protein
MKVVNLVFTLALEGVGSVESGAKARSGFLDAQTFLTQTEMFLQPEAFRRFSHFYDSQVTNHSHLITVTCS